MINVPYLLLNLPFLTVSYFFTFGYIYPKVRFCCGFPICTKSRKIKDDFPRISHGANALSRISQSTKNWGRKTMTKNNKLLNCYSFKNYFIQFMPKLQVSDVYLAVLFVRKKAYRDFSVESEKGNRFLSYFVHSQFLLTLKRVGLSSQAFRRAEETKKLSLGNCSFYWRTILPIFF